jgi:porin
MLTTCVVIGPSARAAEITDRLQTTGVLAGGYQYADVVNPAGVENRDGYAVPFQLELAYLPTAASEFFVKLGFASGNGLNAKSEVTLAPWAADLEADVTHINGRDRSYLLGAWYKYTFTFSATHSLAFTGGIIDATDYLDLNAYSNDEYTQFMNSALVNAANGFAPSYDVGAVADWRIGRFGVAGVVMEAGVNDDGNPLTFFGSQLSHELQTGIGTGHYRLIVQGSNAAYTNPGDSILVERNALILSCDQQIGKTLGAWIRFGWQESSAAVDHAHIYSGGLDLGGRLWGREADNLGLAYAHLGNGNLEIERTDVVETYLRLALGGGLDVTADLQYVRDTYTASDNREVLIYGLRLAAFF